MPEHGADGPGLRRPGTDRRDTLPHPNRTLKIGSATRPTAVKYCPSTRQVPFSCRAMGRTNREPAGLPSAWPARPDVVRRSRDSPIRGACAPPVADEWTGSLAAPRVRCCRPS
ncbi:hypothetical protein GCM10010430_63040 [Kitasatospora cystarginea]|uniref:Uncharacterized protein n=1 Tax=Kitasatospora cystarginea TaxID=58350 RepID=A0ABP5RR99_9ACTN